MYKQRSGARELFLIYRSIFIAKACEWELGSVRHDLDYVPCDEWHVRNPSGLRTRGTPVECAESTDSSYAKQVPPPPRFPWCNCSWTRKSRGLCETQYSTWWLPPLKYMTNGFLCVFSKKPFRMDYCMSLSSSQRGECIYLCVCCCSGGDH